MWSGGPKQRQDPPYHLEEHKKDKKSKASTYFFLWVHSMPQKVLGLHVSCEADALSNGLTTQISIQRRESYYCGNAEDMEA